MLVLIYGSKGWIGSQFIKLLQNTTDVDIFSGSARVDNTIDLEKEILEISPTHVVSFIGRTHGTIGDHNYSTIDYLEQDGKIVDNIRDNLFSPISLALLCRKHNVHYTYLGTGCIFSENTNVLDAKKYSFDENALPNFFGSAYSTVKGFTDRLMHFFPEVLNLRIRMPIIAEDHPRNFITKITTYEQICSIPNSMTVLPELLPLVVDMMVKKKSGTINLTNPGVISHNQILEYYQTYVNSEFRWKNFTIEQQNTILDSKRSNNYLNTTLLETWYPNIRNINKAIKEICQNYKVDPNILKNQWTPISSYQKLDTRVIPNIAFLDQEHTVLLVTGGAGFIGSNFINIIWKKYYKIRIINLDALYYCGNKDNINLEIRKSSRYTFIEGNLQSYDLIKYIWESIPITHVIHFAAQSHVDDSFHNSLRYTNDNILGTHNLLEVARTKGTHLKLFIHVSTDEVYGESMLQKTEIHKTESSILCPTNPYAATKASAELIALSYQHSFQMPIIITRGNNVYGPNQYPEKVIPRFIQQLKNNKKVTIQGDGSCVRAFLHAYDTATAFQCILEKGKIGEIYNIGCDEGMEYSIIEVAQILIKKIHNTENYNKWISYIEDRPFNDQRYYISNQKLKELGWKITIPFDKGISLLI
mgnify:FL=1|tara:strand:- start:330 stop:2258 length:1929 start_codon:yes stop_codon:yes gene_type:complete